MAWYDTGTVSVTNGSTTVTGSGTNFVSGAQVGEGFYGPDGRLYEIQAIVSATSLTLADSYLGTTQSGQAYKIVPTQSLVANLASQVSTLISDFQTVADEAGEGKFADGSAASPGITFTQDQDTGFFRDTANEIGISIGGAKKAEFNSSGLQFEDNSKAIFGAGSDLQIYHTGAHSYIDDQGTGNLYLNSNGSGTIIQGGGTQARFFNGAGVDLWYNNAQKLATTSTGIDVTGTVTADGLTVSGSADADITRNAAAATDNVELLSLNADYSAATTNGSFGGYLAFKHRTGGNVLVEGAQIGVIGEGANTSDLYIRTSAAPVSEAPKNRIKVDNTGDISFYEDTGTTPKFFWDASSESLGIGTSSPYNASGTLHLAGSTSAHLVISAGTDTNESRIWFGDTSSNTQGRIEYQHSDDSMLLWTNSAERLRIDSSGNLLVGTTNTAPSSNNVVGFSVAPSGFISLTGLSTSAIDCNRTNDGIVQAFRRGGVFVGSVTVSTTATAYNTSSDYRLKEDVQPMVGASDRVLALNPVNFAWKADGTRVDGFLAHEAQAVVPEAVTGTKDEVDADGKPVYQGIDQSKLVPLLTAALQEALKRIEALEAQLNP